MVIFKKYIAGILCCIIMILYTGHTHVWAQGMSVKISSPGQEYAVGDPIEINLSISLPATYKAHWARRLPQIKDIEEADSMRLDSSVKNNVLSYHQRSIIQAFDTGNFKIPPIAVRIIKPGDTVHYIVKTDTLAIRVIGVSVDAKKDIKPVKPPVLIPEVFHIPWRLIMIISGALLIIIIVWLVFKNQNKTPRIISPEQRKSAYEKAMDGLKKLERERDAMVVKTFYTTLSDIIRHYLYEAFDIPAPERTTSGTLRSARSHRFSVDQVQALAELLKRADLVKFAKFHPTTQHSTEDLVKTRKLIDAFHLQGQEPEKKL